jgi:hypothetical protein
MTSIRSLKSGLEYGGWKYLRKKPLEPDIMLAANSEAGDLAQFSSQITELRDIFDAGILERKKHWKKYQLALQTSRKLSPTKLNEDSIKLLGQIDVSFFQTWKVPKFSIFWMNLLVLVTIPIIEITYWALLPFITNFLPALIVYVGMSFFLFFFTHCFFHWLIGALVGIQFRQYFLFRSSFRKVRIFPITILTRFPILGIKYELGSFLRASRWRRTLMLSSAPILTSGWFILNYLPLIHLYGADPLVTPVGGLILIGIILSLIASFFLYGDFWKARQDWR